MVLAHEAVHNVVNSPCERGDFQCKAESEFTAYMTEFFVFDYLGSKNPEYLNVLNAEASTSADLYRKSGKYEVPDYSKATMVRNFFESSNENQDKLWYSVWWLRKNYQMFLIMNNQNADLANQQFFLFLKYMYQNGHM